MPNLRVVILATSLAVSTAATDCQLVKCTDETELISKGNITLETKYGGRAGKAGTCDVGELHVLCDQGFPLNRSTCGVNTPISGELRVLYRVRQRFDSKVARSHLMAREPVSRNLRIEL